MLGFANAQKVKVRDSFEVKALGKHCHFRTSLHIYQHGLVWA